MISVEQNKDGLGVGLIHGVKNRKEAKTTPRFRPEQLGIWWQSGRGRVCECHSNLASCSAL